MNIFVKFQNRRVLWGTIALLTTLNLVLYFQRWAEKWTVLPSVLDYSDITSLLAGMLITFVAFSFYGLLKTKHFVLGGFIVAVTVAFAWSLQFMQTFQVLLKVSPLLVLVGVAIGALCFSHPEEKRDPSLPIENQGRWFSFYFFASFNFFLLVDPIASALPTLVTDSPKYKWANFYYGSLHNDFNPLYVVTRRTVNYFFELFMGAPSINASGYFSVFLTSIALAVAAITVHRLFGQMWAWAFLSLSWTDKWIFACSVNSGLVAQPLIVGAAGFWLCVTYLFKEKALLTKKELTTLGLLCAAGTLYCLYTYTAARFVWFGSYTFLFFIIFARGLLRFDSYALKGLIRVAAPSMASMFVLWLCLFHGDSESFFNQILTSPSKDKIIEAPEVLPPHYKLVEEVDWPIWYATVQDSQTGRTLFYKRSLGELATKVTWFFKQLTIVTNVASFLVGLGVFAMIMGLFSSNAQQRKLFGLLGAFTAISYASVLFCQAPDAYRRGICTELILMVILTSLFAYMSRSGKREAAALGTVFAFALVKAPLELQPVVDDVMNTPVCVQCTGQGATPIKDLVNAEVFNTIKDRQVFFLVNYPDVSLQQITCLTTAINAVEMKSRAPKSSVFRGSPGVLSQSLDMLAPGDVLILTCNNSYHPNTEYKEACAGTSATANHLGLMPAITKERSVWWAALEKR